MMVKTETRNWDKWIEGVIMTVLEDQESPLELITSIQMEEYIDKKYADKEWKERHPIDKSDCVSRGMTRLTRRKYLNSDRDSYSIWYSINPEFVFAN